MSKFVLLKGKEFDVRINTTFILAYAYDKETNQTIVWFLGKENSTQYPGDQRKEISLAIVSQ